MMLLTALLAALVGLLMILNLIQFLTQRSATRMAEILYIVSRRLREKASEVRTDNKDSELLEAHLLDLEGFVQSLLLILGRKNVTIASSPLPGNRQAPPLDLQAHRPARTASRPLVT